MSEPADIAQATEPPPAGRGSNRGFWLIAGGLFAAGAVIVLGALLTSPEPPGTDATANLELALRAAKIAEAESGSYASATADELAVIEVRLTFLPGGRSSSDPAQVSVQEGPGAWVAAALATNGACRWIRVEPHQPEDSVVRGTGPGASCSAETIALSAPSIIDAP